MEKVNVIEGVTLIKSGFYLPPFCLSSYSRLLYCVCKKYSTQVECEAKLVLKKRSKRTSQNLRRPLFTDAQLKQPGG